mmetsp:Transcript_12123/g.51001  ORF Transcript_12123/g.51001 Transcript_12123/m.51001 type:complete len:249 (-) Transcript_12123:670-1416(-)
MRAGAAQQGSTSGRGSAEEAGSAAQRRRAQPVGPRGGGGGGDVPDAHRGGGGDVAHAPRRLLHARGYRRVVVRRVVTVLEIRRGRRMRRRPRGSPDRRLLPMPLRRIRIRRRGVRARGRGFVLHREGHLRGVARSAGVTAAAHPRVRSGFAAAAGGAALSGSRLGLAAPERRLANERLAGQERVFEELVEAHALHGVPSEQTPQYGDALSAERVCDFGRNLRVGAFDVPQQLHGVHAGERRPPHQELV